MSKPRQPVSQEWQRTEPAAKGIDFVVKRRGKDPLQTAYNIDLSQPFYRSEGDNFRFIGEFEQQWFEELVLEDWQEEYGDPEPTEKAQD